MATLAAAAVGTRRRAHVLVAGLGMGFTLRATLDAFRHDASVTVAELLPAVVRYNRGVIGHLAGHPLTDRRVRLHEGDVADAMQARRWDAILLDLDNGPEDLTSASNARLYDDAGVARIGSRLTPGGIVVVWSAGPNRRFEKVLRRAALTCETHGVQARGPGGKGGRHTLFVGRRSERASR